MSLDFLGISSTWLSDSNVVFGIQFTTFTMSDRFGDFEGVFEKFSAAQTIEVGGALSKVTGKMIIGKTKLDSAPVIGKLLTIDTLSYRIVHFDEDALAYEIYFGSKNR